MTFGPTKTRQRRVAVLPRLLVEPLAEHIGAPEPDAFVFPAPGGGVLRNSNFGIGCWSRQRGTLGSMGSQPTTYSTRRRAWRSPLGPM